MKLSLLVDVKFHFTENKLAVVANVILLLQLLC